MTEDIEHRSFWDESERPFVPELGKLTDFAEVDRLLKDFPLYRRVREMMLSELITPEQAQQMSSGEIYKAIDPTNLHEDFPDMVP